MTGQPEALLAALLRHLVREYRSGDAQLIEPGDVTAMADRIDGSVLSSSGTCPVCSELVCDESCPLRVLRDSAGGNVLVHLAPGEHVRIVPEGHADVIIPERFDGLLVVTTDPGYGSTVRTLEDSANPETTLRDLTAVQSTVLAARFTTWAEHLVGPQPGTNVPPGAMRCSVAGCPEWIDAGTPTATATAMRHHEREAHNQ